MDISFISFMARAAGMPSMKQGRGLTNRQRLAKQLVLDGDNVANACQKLGISQPTLWRWKQSPAWQVALWEAVRGEQKDGEVQIRTMVPQASKVVQQLLITGTDQIKLGASRLVLEAVHALTQQEEQREMLADLEAQLEELKQAAAQQLPPGTLEAEILEVAHTDAHTERLPVEVSQ